MGQRTINECMVALGFVKNKDTELATKRRWAESTNDVWKDLVRFVNRELAEESKQDVAAINSLAAVWVNLNAKIWSNTAQTGEYDLRDDRPIYPADASKIVNIVARLITAKIETDRDVEIKAQKHAATSARGAKRGAESPVDSPTRKYPITPQSRDHSAQQSASDEPIADDITHRSSPMLTRSKARMEGIVLEQPSVIASDTVSESSEPQAGPSSPPLGSNSPTDVALNRRVSSTVRESPEEQAGMSEPASELDAATDIASDPYDSTLKSPSTSHPPETEGADIEGSSLNHIFSTEVFTAPPRGEQASTRPPWSDNDGLNHDLQAPLAQIEAGETGTEEALVPGQNPWNVAGDSDIDNGNDTDNDTDNDNNKDNGDYNDNNHDNDHDDNNDAEILDNLTRSQFLNANLGPPHLPVPFSPWQFEPGRVWFHIRSADDPKRRSHHMTLTEAHTPYSFKQRVTQLLLLEGFVVGEKTVVAYLPWVVPARVIPLRTFADHHALMMEVWSWPGWFVGGDRKSVNVCRVECVLEE